MLKSLATSLRTTVKQTQLTNCINNSHLQCDTEFVSNVGAYPTQVQGGGDSPQAQWPVWSACRPADSRQQIARVHSSEVSKCDPLPGVWRSSIETLLSMKQIKRKANFVLRHCFSLTQGVWGSSWNTVHRFNAGGTTNHGPNHGPHTDGQFRVSN